MKAELAIVKGAPAKKLRLGPDRPTTIGRSNAADLQIRSNVVSRIHCQITHDGKAWVLSDLDSRNGTWADGERVRGRVLQDGDVFSLGKRVVLRFTIPEQTREMPKPQGVLSEDCPFCGCEIERAAPTSRGADSLKYHEGCHSLLELLGADLGGIRVIDRISGSSGVHRFRGHQPSLNRHVMLLVFDEAATKDPDFGKKLLEEVRGVSRLLHPNILQIHDLIEHRGSKIVAMEHFPGSTLEDILARRRFVNVTAALSIASQVAEGMAYAEDHDQFTDRLCPADILVDDENAAKVDFFRPPMVRRVDTAALTYLAPEALSSSGLRISGERPSGDQASRSAVYSLGTILYHMLSGIPPFEGKTEEELLPKIVKDTPPALRRVNLKVSPALARMVERAMDKDASARPPNFRTFKHDIKKIIAPAL